MEFMNRSGQQPTASAAPAPARPANGGGRRQRGKFMRMVSAFLLVSAGLLIASVAVYIATSNSRAERDYLDKDKFQAVFLNGGQVYFGKVRDLNNKFLTLDNIYYLRVNEQAAGEGENAGQAQQDISLAKLGCELHGPEDRMVINRDQVTFWENLKDDGQVVKAISEFVRQNPEGQSCDQPASE